MARAGLSPAVVARAAAELIDRDGPAALTLAGVADSLGVRSPSLYKHVDGLAGLERLVALDGLGQLVESCRTALLGRSGADGLRAMSEAYRAFAVAHPGVYPLTQVARPGDAEFQATTGRLMEAVAALLAGFGVPEAELIHATRMVRCTLHGFAMLEAQAGFGLAVDVDQSFDWLLDSLERGLVDVPA
jgi:AcrR family transcriptional regulator